jgi:uncharacterized protein
LEHVFLLPMPKIQGSCRLPDIQPWKESQAREQIAYWSDRLDSLSFDKTLWTQIGEELRLISQPALIFLSQFASTSDKQSILHLAVRDDQLDCISMLGSDKSLLQRRNRFGLTPLELALYLHKQKSALALMGSSQRCEFLEQPNVEFEKNDHLASLDIEYLAQPIFASLDLLDEILIHTQKAKNDEIISSERIWMGVYYDKEIQQGIHPCMSVRWVDDEIGFGVFAAERILPCSYVGEYTGLIQERKTKHIRESNYCIRYTSWPMGRRQHVIDAENMGNFTRFINHSDTPNISLVSTYWRGLPRLIFLSLQEIPEGTQLTFDYGKTFWKQSPNRMKKKL